MGFLATTAFCISHFLILYLSSCVRKFKLRGWKLSFSQPSRCLTRYSVSYVCKNCVAYDIDYCPSSSDESLTNKDESDYSDNGSVVRKHIHEQTNRLATGRELTFNIQTLYSNVWCSHAIALCYSTTSCDKKHPRGHLDGLTAASSPQRWVRLMARSKDYPTSAFISFNLLCCCHCWGMMVQTHHGKISDGTLFSFFLRESTEQTRECNLTRFWRSWETRDSRPAGYDGHELSKRLETGNDHPADGCPLCLSAPKIS